MNQTILFKAIEVIIRKYSKMSPRYLIDNFLRLKIVFNLSLDILSSFLPSTDLPPALSSVFTNKTRSEKMTNFSCIIIDHPKLQSLTSKLFEAIENCVVIDPNLRQCNNILGKPEISQRQNMSTKIILLRTTRQNFDSLTQSLDSYLSFCELFHSHVHLIVNCFECYPTLVMKEHIQQVIGDQFQGVVQQGYFRILEQRASKITLEELSQICQIERNQWGQTLIFEGGHDGLIVWISEKFFPKLGISPNVSIPLTHSKQYLLFYTTDVGYKIFKKKQLMKENMHELNFTTIIFNFDNYSPQSEKIVALKFEQYCKSFFSQVVMKTEMRLLQENIKHGERLCEILQVQSKEVLQKLLEM